MAPAELWGRVSFVASDGTVLGSWDMTWPSDRDLVAVDQLARIQLRAGRLGGRVVVEGSPFLLELLDLSGLPVEVRRQPEKREQPRSFEEEVEPRDPSP
jgi:hypothetical protein